MTARRVGPASPPAPTRSVVRLVVLSVVVGLVPAACGGGSTDDGASSVPTEQGDGTGAGVTDPDGAGADVTDDAASPTSSAASSGAPSGSGVTGRPGPWELIDATADLGVDRALVGIRGHAVAAADVNGDGWDDLFVGTFADREPETYEVRGADGPAPDRLLLGGPDGFTVDPDFEGRLGRTAGARFADLDGDGDPDLVVSRNVREGERQDAPSEIYRNDDGALVPATVLDDHRGGRAVVPLDVDRDGLLDLVLVEDRWSGGSTAIYGNNGDLSFTEVGADLGFPPDVAGLGAAVGDLNGDGLDDLVIGGSNRWFLGDDDGRLTEGMGSPLPWELHGDEDDPAHVVLLDVDGDGRLDVVIGQHFNSTVDADRPEPIRLFRNGGTDDAGQPTFVDATVDVGLPAFGTKSPQVLAVDLDLDGDPELVATASIGADGEPEAPVVLDDGDRATFSAVPDDPTGPHYWIDAVTLDADHDGRPDLFFLEWEPSIGSRLYLNRVAG